MEIQKLVELVETFIEEKDITEKEKKSRAANIKKQYKITLQELKANGRIISFQDSQRLMKPLIENYDWVKDNNSINETLQSMAEELKFVFQASDKEKEKIQKTTEKIYTLILGNPGTTIDGMSSDYIAQIIKRKMTEKDGINREDILNVLDMQSKNMYIDIDKYQQLINDTVIAYLTSSKDAEKITNPKIFKIFEGLATSYKVQEKYDKARDTYENALKIYSMEDNVEYQETKEKYQQFMEFLGMKTHFKKKYFNNLEELDEFLKITFSEKSIFVKGKKANNSRKRTSKEDKKVQQNSYVMPVEKKRKGLSILLKKIEEEYEDVKVRELEYGAERYDGYTIVKVNGANISILENFNEVNARIFIVDNEVIDVVRQLARNEAVNIDGVVAINHVSNFENYCKNLIFKTFEMIERNRKKFKNKDEIGFSFNNSQNSKKEENNSEELDEVELERRKAIKNREHLIELKQKLSNLQKETDKKIEDVYKE